MTRLAVLRDPRLYPLWVAIVAASILFVRLGSYGFWEPHEIKIADRAHEIAYPDAGEAGTSSTDENPARAKPAHKQTRSELSAEITAKAITVAGRGEASSRGPFALLALLTVLATYFIGLRVAGPRAGLFASAVIISFPAILMHGRHLTSEIGSAAGSALIVLGLLGLLSARGFGFRKEPRSLLFLYPIDGLLVVVGVWLSYRSAGALLGVLPPFAAIGLAAAMFVTRATSFRVRLRTSIAAGVGVAGALISFFVFFTGVFDLVDPDEINAANEEKVAKGAIIEKVEGYAVLGGMDVEIERDYVEALTGIWRKNGDRRVGFSTPLVSIAVGTFPWIALIPIAVFVLLIGRGREESAGRTALALWALAAYVAGAIFARKVGPAMYPAWAALAGAVGVWLADAFATDRRKRPDASEDGVCGALPLAAFFVVCAAGVVGRDIVVFPEELLGLNLMTGKLDFPIGFQLQYVWILLGWAAALSLAAALAMRDGDSGDRSSRIVALMSTARRAAQRYGLVTALALGIVSAAFFTQVLTPKLSTKLSPKHSLSVYHDLRVDGDLLGIMGKARGASYYASTKFERLQGRSQLVKFLERPQRVFALAPASERCPLYKAARKRGLPYYVVDANARYLLYSNRLEDGEKDVDPLKKTFFTDIPTDIRKSVSWNLDDRIELVGVSMPDSVRRGSSIKMKLYFKVNKPIARNWKVLVHFDNGIKINGDHKPLGGTCGTQHWVPGDVVVDEFEVQTSTHPTGTYQAFVGFFIGSRGNWTNMRVVTEGASADNRIPIGTVTLK